MDSLRGQFPDIYGPNANDSSFDAGYDPYEDETGREPPPAVIGQDERRMQVRAYNFWAALLEDRNFPSVSSLDPHSLEDFGPFSVLLDFGNGIENPKIAYLGDKLAEECGADKTLEWLNDVPGRSLLSRITDHYMQILANQAPVGFEAEFVNQRSATIMYRGILLPFSSNDEEIDFIYGVINWKELADQQTTDELLLQIDQALEGAAKFEREDVPLTEWADGPANLLNYTQEDESGFASQSEPGLPEPGSRFDGPLDLREFAREELLGETPDADMGLADWLASARERAQLAKGCEDRSRQALYEAISRAHDFAIAAALAPEDFAELVTDAGLAVQERAPMTPLVKLVFGADYDKTRLAEYATVLGHASRIGLGRGELAGHLAAAVGGLKGIVAAERNLRRTETARAEPRRRKPRKAIVQRLRALETRPIAAVPATGAEFTLLVARRLDDGTVAVLGEVGDDAGLLERAARRLFD